MGYEVEKKKRRKDLRKREREKIGNVVQVNLYLNNFL